MSHSALIVWGGWSGHEPEKVAALQGRILRERGFAVEIADTLDAFNDLEKLKSLSLIVPAWTMGEISKEQCANVCKAVEGGVGLGGCHGGMSDAFRKSTEWQFMVGGQFVAHPGNHITHTVHTCAKTWITEGVPAAIEVHTEQYYMHVDPSIRVLQYTEFPTADGPHVPNGRFQMPVTWTRQHGQGRVFHTAFGHVASLLEHPPILRLVTRGLLWAARAESVVVS